MPSISIDVDPLCRLIEVAEEWFVMQASEYSNYPDTDDLCLMKRVWKEVGKVPPPWFRRLPNWTEE